MRSDAELVAAFREGDTRAGNTLVDRYYGRVLGFFRNKVPTHASDLAQRTFLGCFDGLGRMRSDDNFRRFLFAVACNQLRKHYDTSRREGERIDYGSVSSADLDPSPSRIAASHQEQQALLEALRRIPLDYQIVLELHFWEDMTAPEIATTLELALGTAKTRIRRGRQLLEQALAEQALAPGVRESTIGDLDGWARQLRDQVRAGQISR
ncbi:MAG: sigma-70 family RNA polymerase sigma factor [Myxococcales bacterium]|nr:sigma-70 family RNA polymerase sigma factor [Myxococcales bacterium]